MKLPAGIMPEACRDRILGVVRGAEARREMQGDSERHEARRRNDE